MVNSATLYCLRMTDLRLWVILSSLFLSNFTRLWVATLSRAPSWPLAGNVKLWMRPKRRGRPEHDELRLSDGSRNYCGQGFCFWRIVWTLRSFVPLLMTLEERALILTISFVRGWGVVRAENPRWVNDPSFICYITCALIWIEWPPWWLEFPWPVRRLSAVTQASFDGHKIIYGFVL